MPSLEYGDNVGLTGSGGDRISSSSSSWVEERWSCSSAVSAYGTKQAGLGGSRDSPLCSVPPMGTCSPRSLLAAARPVLAVAAVLAVALGRAVALQQAALAGVGVLHRVLLPIHTVVVFYHAAEGGSTALIQGSPFLTSHWRCWREAWDIPSATASLGNVP